MRNCIVLSRKELFDAVWKTPLSKLVEKYGISDVAIKKKCVKYEVPTPPRGYWAKKNAGHKVKIPTLAIGEYNPEIVIYPSSPDKIKGSIIAREQMIKRERIPDKLNKPIRFVRETKTAYKKAYRFADPFLYVPKDQKVLSLKVSANLLSWALKVYDSILKALEKDGYQFYYSSEDRYGKSKFIASKLGVPINLYIYEIRKIKKTGKSNQEYEMTGLLAIKISGKFCNEAIIYEKKECEFQNQLAKILNKIEYIVMSIIERDRLRRVEHLHERKKERLKKLSLRRHEHLMFIKNKEKKQFRALIHDATKHNNCNIIRQYLEVMECKWRKESSNLSKKQKDKLKETRILIDRYDPLVAEYKNLQDLHIDNDMLHKPWSEIQKVINDWLKI